MKRERERSRLDLLCPWPTEDQRGQCQRCSQRPEQQLPHVVASPILVQLPLLLHQELPRHYNPLKPATAIETETEMYVSEPTIAHKWIDSKVHDLDQSFASELFSRFFFCGFCLI
jgi:hypothetical protein